jgi:heavy metal translocating P-type ATPase
MTASTTAAASTYAGIVRLVEAAQGSKAPISRLADRWALGFLALTIAIAAVAYGLTGDPVQALAVLVVATPCPLILAVPVAMVSGMSQAAKRGILVKSAGALELLAKARILLLDKTGTLTEGRARLTAIAATPGTDPDRLLRAAASLARTSQHVLAESVVASARERRLALAPASSAREVAGRGLEGRVEGHRVVLGSPGFVSETATLDEGTRAAITRAMREDSALMLVAIDGAVAGALVMADAIRLDAARTTRALRAAGIERVELVTGDRADLAAEVGAALGLDRVHPIATPQDKAAVVAAARRQGLTVMVGDGINDAPALALADIGVAMGARGAAASVQAADVVLLVDRIDRLADAIGIARRTRAIAVSSAAAGIALSLIAMAAAALGHLPPVQGALVQEVIDVVVVLNALRALAPPRAGRSGERLAQIEVSSLRQEHRELEPVLDGLRATADRLHDPAATRDELKALASALEQRVVPHELNDDASLYPRMGRLLGGQDPMGPMSRGHREILQRVRALRRLIATVPAEGPDRETRHELQRQLYALEALLRLHFAQEDEIYHALEDTRQLAGSAAD